MVGTRDLLSLCGHWATTGGHNATSAIVIMLPREVPRALFRTARCSEMAANIPLGSISAPWCRGIERLPDLANHRQDHKILDTEHSNRQA